jgi:hypothetical protein
MTLPQPVKLSQIHSDGKNFKWIRPALCPRCQQPKIWGHGYVSRFFNSIIGLLYIKRWRCHGCKLVITCRPEEFWRRYQESIDQIFEALKYRIENLRWPPWTTRQKGGHWMNRLIRKSQANLMLKECMLETIHFFQHKKLTIF